MAYNMTSMVAGNDTGMLTLVQSVNNQLMFGWFGALVLMGVGMVIFTSLMFKTDDITRSMATTMFILFSLSIPMVALELLSPLAIFITLIGAAISIAVSWKNS